MYRDLARCCHLLVIDAITSCIQVTFQLLYFSNLSSRKPLKMRRRTLATIPIPMTVFTVYIYLQLVSLQYLPTSSVCTSTDWCNKTIHSSTRLNMSSPWQYRSISSPDPAPLKCRLLGTRDAGSPCLPGHELAVDDRFETNYLNIN